MKLRTYRSVTFIVALSLGMLAPSALSQPADSYRGQEVTTMSGTVVSSSPNTLTIRTDQGQYQLFVFDHYTAKPKTIAVGSSVRVFSTQGGEPGVRVATDVIVASPPATGEQKASTDVVPASVRQLESDIERSAKKYAMGLRGGVGLDPEMLIIGVHARFGQFYKSVSFRPSVEFGWGEITKQFAVNFEGAYRLPFTPRTGRWHAYAGGGPSLVFAHENFERFTGEDEDIDFGDFKFDAGLNILAGMQFRNGVFFELKTTVYAAPHLRLIMGFNF